jgi:DNA-binding GntR family transcriptional regulator
VNDRDPDSATTYVLAQTSRGSSKTDLVYDRLRDDIVAGRLNPGAPISERAVADAYDVSRVPVREALIRLERNGLVETWPRRGAAVKVLSAENMLSLYLAREAIEGMAARLAAARGSQDAFESMRQRLEAELAGGADKAVLTQIGDDLHDAVISASRNSVLVELAATIADRVKMGRRLSYRGSTDSSLHIEAAREHLRITEAIVSADPDAAEQVMRSHIANWAARLNDQVLGDYLER